eukprot:TRINITY_DN26624_c0_g1_i1.p1 TRINITY_DN26624_c0_g1~~TRINITY_DN26624_c0_g1_i1.p1  ORF type:complete len:279 (+),score=49.47 TRINITY_DN26624_c0_g1_i1:217-1053(+)
MDGTVREHTLCMELLSLLHRKSTLSAEMIQLGFYRTVEAMDDLCLDVPSAAGILGKFVLCAVADGMLSKEFLESMPTESPGGTLPSSEQSQFRRTLYNMYQQSLWLADVGSDTGIMTMAHEVPISPRGICIAAAAACTASRERKHSGSPSRSASPRSPKNLQLKITPKPQRVEMVSMTEIRRLSEAPEPSPVRPYMSRQSSPNWQAANEMCADMRRATDALEQVTGNSEGRLRRIKFSSPRMLEENQDTMMNSLQSMYDLQKRVQSLDNSVATHYAPF